MNIQAPLDGGSSNNPQNSLTTNSRPDEYPTSNNISDIINNYSLPSNFANAFSPEERKKIIEALNSKINEMNTENSREERILRTQGNYYLKALASGDATQIIDYYNNIFSNYKTIPESINEINGTITNAFNIISADINISNLEKNNESIFFTDFEKNMFPVLEELLALNGLLDQHPTTGRYISAEENSQDGKNLKFNAYGINDDGYRKKLVKIINAYRNKLFGAPFQFLDSVDARFSSTNKYVGYEFLRNFLLHSAILHIYPGNTKYTGGNDSKFKSISDIIKALALDVSRSNSNEHTQYTNLENGWAKVYGQFENFEATTGVLEQSILQLFMRSKLQRRLFGISFQYESYLRYVKLMCHGVALLLKLTGSTYLQGEYPNGTFVNYYSTDKEIIGDGKEVNPLLRPVRLSQDSKYKFQTFKNINWGNYRMIEDSSTVVQEIEQTAKATMDKITKLVERIPSETFGKLGEGGKELAWDAIQFIWYASPFGAWDALTQAAKDGNNSFLEKLDEGGRKYFEKLGSIGNEALKDLGEMAKSFEDVLKEYTELRYDIAERVQSIEFMVEPVNATESYQNDVGPSRLKSSVDSINSLGAEISFITNSGATTGLANTIITGGKEVINEAFQTMSQIATPFTGNFIGNLFSGAIGAITGNRFIYPDIYQNSSSHADYNFKVNLSSPYGDIYNYYMNIIVPLCHLQALCLPKLKTSNSINSPFLVRAFIPGLMTCEMGIIDNMNVTKNPQNNRVSVNNFPLDVQVSFTIRELYHNLAISPTDDGLSYINNETLKDYLCNMAGIYPTFNREIELNLSTADMLKSQFDLWTQIQRNGSASFLSFLGLLN